LGRFLFVVPPLVGHINPAGSVAAELAARGHEVAWAGHPELIRKLTTPDAVVHACALPTEEANRSADLKGPAAFQFLWQNFLVPLADAMAPGVRAAIEDFAPDVVVCDQQAVAGALVAESMGVPWVTSATTSAELTDPLRAMPKVAAWLDDLLAGLRARIADGRGSADPRMSPHGVLAFTTAELLGETELPDNVWLLGPSVATRPAATDFPWSWCDADDLPIVLISLGTANADAAGGFLTAAADAMAGLAGKVRAVIVDPAGVLDRAGADTVEGADLGRPYVPDPSGTDGDTLPAPGTAGHQMLVSPYVPQLPLLERVDAVVCHAGHNTVCEALWHGVPLVVAPIRDDQPIVAGQVVDAGAGVRLRFGRSTPDRIAAAITAVLDPENGHREAARRIGASFRSAGGSTAAADRLEELLGRLAGA
jgi:UDP:flavonoid glycosyltransferase YjiC (YdhE family)